MFRLPLLASLLVTTGAVAQERAQCSEAVTQLEINDCAEADFELADKELNSLYRAILAKHEQDRGFIQRLRAAQRAWIAFRDAELEAAFFCNERRSSDCFGSIGPMSYSALKARLTRDRTAQLREMISVRQCPGCG